MTYKNTRNYNKYIKYHEQSITIDTMSIISWCQIVLDLLDLTFAELFYGFTIITRIVVWIPQRTL